MSAADPAAEPRPVRRLGLYLPFLLVLVALAGWTLWWFVLADRIGRETDRLAADLRRGGYQVSFSERTVTGWPFRAFVQFRDLKLVAPSGHALEAPRLAAEAQAYAVDRWVMAAPQGLVLTRGDKGRVRVDGKAVRASVSGVGATPPRIVVELLAPTFTPLPGAEPFPLASAEVIDLYLRPKTGAAGDGEFLFRIEGGRGRAEGVLNWIAGGEPFSTRFEGTLRQAAHFGGGGWADAVRRWSAAGGGLTGVRGEVEAGDASARARADRLDIGPDGRLRGSVALELDGGPAPLIALGRAPDVNRGAAVAAAAGAAAQGETARFTLTFAADGTRLGPLRLAPAPKVF